MFPIRKVPRHDLASVECNTGLTLRLYNHFDKVGCHSFFAAWAFMIHSPRLADALKVRGYRSVSVSIVYG